MDLVPKKKNLWDAFLVFLSLKELWILPGCFVHPVVCSLSVGGGSLLGCARVTVHVQAFARSSAFELPGSWEISCSSLQNVKRFISLY